LGGCGGCQNDYKKYIDNLNIFRFVSSKLELSTFFVDLHTYINNKKFEQQNKYAISSQFKITTNKSINEQVIFCDYETVKNKYNITDYISLLEEKYAINMFKLIESKSLATFYELFNKIKFDSNVFNIDITII
jgi:hypothetical protein